MILEFLKSKFYINGALDKNISPPPPTPLWKKNTKQRKNKDEVMRILNLSATQHKLPKRPNNLHVSSYKFF